MIFTYLFSQVKYFITWNRKFSCCKASRNTPNCVETEAQKWTWDMWQKDLDPSLQKDMSPLWWSKKRGFFTLLPPLCSNVTFWATFFFEGIPNNLNTLQCAMLFLYRYSKGVYIFFQKFWSPSSSGFILVMKYFLLITPLAMYQKLRFLMQIADMSFIFGPT